MFASLVEQYLSATNTKGHLYLALCQACVVDLLTRRGGPRIFWPTLMSNDEAQRFSATTKNVVLHGSDLSEKEDNDNTVHASFMFMEYC